MPCKQENGMFLNMQVLNMHVLDGMPGFTVSGHYMPGQNAILPRFAGFRGALTRSIAAATRLWRAPPIGRRRNGKLGRSGNFFAGKVVMAAGKAKVHFLVAPKCAANLVLFQSLVNVPKPADCIFLGCAVNYTVFPTVERDTCLL